MKEAQISGHLSLTHTDTPTPHTQSWSLSPHASPSAGEVFARLRPEDVEQFYHSYQIWTLQQQFAPLQDRIEKLKKQIEENAQRMREVEPGPLALSVLAQLQARGVDDLDLLDRLLERGEIWLDHTLQLLTRCEQLGVIGESYSRWCEHALEGAYDWIDSMDQASTEPHEIVTTPADTHGVATEEELLQKLMSEEDEETTKIAAAPSRRITNPLPHPRITVPLHARITRPLPPAITPLPTEEITGEEISTRDAGDDTETDGEVSAPESAEMPQTPTPFPAPVPLILQTTSEEDEHALPPVSSPDTAPSAAQLSHNECNEQENKLQEQYTREPEGKQDEKNGENKSSGPLSTLPVQGEAERRPEAAQIASARQSFFARLLAGFRKK
ncbi:MAG: hypothetical protein IMW89_01650 [Ktedonobacteraceae bacterium]|nr:hypothetical protein [Ktedonobacteraceae bacterium]